MASKLRAPQESGEMGRVVQKVYDDINSVIDNINTDLKGIKEPSEKSKDGSIAVVKEGNTYSIRGKTADGWAKIPMKLLNEKPESSIKNAKKFTSADTPQELIDSTGGTAATSLSAIGTTHDVDRSSDINNNISSLNRKINHVKDLSDTQNERINELIDKVNSLIKTFN
tara:strand:+ start:27 stop:533 length:507 start_codon:yes stop_codon:yes gene_type:complete